MRKVISLLCVVTLMLCTLCVGGISFVFAQTEGDFEVEIREDGAAIIRYNGTDTSIDIPSELGGYAVTTIGTEAFAGQTIECLTLPPSLMCIEDRAFAECTIGSAFFNGSVWGWINMAIGTGNDTLHTVVRVRTEDGFLWRVDNESLAVCGYEGYIYELVIPSEIDGYPVTTIAAEAFAGQSIEYLTLQSSITCIEDRAFADCTIGYAFFDGSAYEWATLTESHIGAENEALVQSVELYHDSGFYFTVENGAVTIKGYSGYDTYPVIPSEIDGFPVTTIGAEAFVSATIEYLTLPSSITCVEDNAFMYSSIRHAYYDGSASDWSMVYVGSGNEALLWALCIRSDSGFLYAVENGSAVIKGYEGNELHLTIPSELGGYPVTSIGYEALRGLYVETLTLPSSIQQIGTRAFGSAFIGRAYYDGTVSSWLSVGVEPENTALEQALVLQDGQFLVSLYAEGIYGAIIVGYTGEPNVDTLTIPECIDVVSVAAIGPEAFAGMSIGSITFPASITHIADRAFADCTLGNAYLTDYFMSGWSAMYIGADNDVLYHAMVHQYDWYLYKVENNGATIIDMSDPYGTPSEFAVPAEMHGYPVTAIGAEAFAGSWANIVTLPETIQSIGPRAFADCGLYRVCYPGSAEDFATVSVDPDNEELLWALTFKEDIWWYQVGSDNTVTIVGCDEYETVMHLDIPAAINGYPVVSVSYDVFSSFTCLESLLIPASIRYIDCEAWPSTLYTIYYSGSEEDYYAIEFSYYSQPEYYTWIYNVASLGEQDGFEYCVRTDNTAMILSYYGNEPSLTIPDTLSGAPVTQIGKNAFEWAYSLSSVIIPDSVTSIAFGAFWGTEYYNNIDNWQSGGLYVGDILVEVKEIEGDSFTVRDGTRMIADEAFTDEGMTTVKIPKSVTILGNDAFRMSYASALSELYYGGTEAEWNAICFGDNADVSDRVMMYYGEPVLGDATGDGVITTSDARIALQGVLDGNLSEEDVALMDMNGDGAVSTKDVRIMMVQALRNV